VRREAKTFLISLVSWLLVLAFLMVLVGEALSRPEDWEFERKLTDTGYAIYPKVALSEDVVHIVYFDNPSQWHDSPRSPAQVVYTRSTDGGRSWSRHMLSRECYAFHEPIAIASSNDMVYVAWSEGRTDWEHDLMFAISHDQGMNWGTPRILATHRDFIVMSLKVVAEGDRVVVLYMTKLSMPMSSSSLMIVSENRGDDWSRPRYVPKGAGNVYDAVIVDSALYISFCYWQGGGDDVSFLLFSPDWGTTWNESRIGQDITGDFCAFDLKIRNGMIGVLAEEGYTHSALVDLNWSHLNQNVSGWRLLDSDEALLALSYSHDDGIYAQLSYDEGEEWTVKIPILELNERYQRNFNAESSGGDVAFVWIEKREATEFMTEEVFLMVSHDFGVTWSEPTRITDHVSELALPLFVVTVLVLLLMTVLMIWSFGEFIRARRRRPILF